MSSRGPGIRLVGIVYKPDVDGARESPVLDLLRLLQHKGAEVKYHDQHVWELTLDGSVYASQPLPEAVASSGSVVMVTNHSSLDMHALVEEAKLVIHIRKATRGIHGDKIRKL